MRRPVITGIGVVSSIGIGKDSYWDSLSKGVCGIREISIFDTSGYKGKLGGEIKDLEPERYFERKELRRLSRCDQIGGIALMEAIHDSGIDLDSIDKTRLSVVIGSGSGGLLSGEQFKRRIFNNKKPRPSLLVSFLLSAFTDFVAQKTGSRGYRATISTACSSSSTAIGIAGDIIKKSLADYVITGGSESLSETTFSGFNSLRAIDEIPCRPFDRERKGLSLGEGAAIFFVEEYNHAKARGAKMYAEIASYGLSCDAYHVTSPAPDGKGIAHAILSAILRSGIHLEDIGYINAHGTATPANDVAETNAIKSVFKKYAYRIPVSSTKSMIGHCLGSAGALEAAAAILPFNRNIIPPTIHYENPDPECDLDYVPEPRIVSDINVVISTSIAFGGNNTALILRRVT